MPPITLSPLTVQIKANWTDPWNAVPNVEPITGSTAAAAISSFQFRVRYGNIKHPTAAGFQTTTHTQINRQWLRAIGVQSLSSPPFILFQGRVESDTRTLYGPNAGAQMFTAYGGGQLLSKLKIYQTKVTPDGPVELHDTMIPFNRHPTGRQRNDNRSTSKFGSSYVFQFDAQRWTVQDAIEYLFSFANDPAGPAWVISGETLDFELSPIALKSGTSVFAALRQILSFQTGYSFVILPTAIGYDFRIFSTNTLASPVSFGNVTIPANPNSILLDNSINPEIRVILEESQTNQVGKVVVLGNPMVICRSFRNSDTDDSLKKDWRDSLIPAYKAGNDMERRLDKYANLWTRYVANLNSAYWPASQHPSIDSDGTINTSTAAPIPAFATTLKTLPLQAGNDYANGVPNPEEIGDFLTPKLFMTDFRERLHEFENFEGVEAELVTLADAIGIHIRTELPHAFSGDFSITNSLVPVTYDPETKATILTIAYESTQRMRREHESADFQLSDGVMTIEVDADLWWMAPKTTLAVDPSVTDPPFNEITTTSAQLIRDEGDLLDYQMAGAIARYITPRGKASGNAEGLFDWHTQIGSLIVTDDPDIRSILTTVSWKFENGYITTFKSGFAR